jgi:hypothetical protein
VQVTSLEAKPEKSLALKNQRPRTKTKTCMPRKSERKPLLFSSNPPALNGSGLVCLPLCRQNDLVSHWRE